MWNTAFKNLERHGLLKRNISTQFFKGCLPQILLGPFLSTLPQMLLKLLIAHNIVKPNNENSSKKNSNEENTNQNIPTFDSNENE